jgi:hypothetical protein
LLFRMNSLKMLVMGDSCKSFSKKNDDIRESERHLIADVGNRYF